MLSMSSYPQEYVDHSRRALTDLVTAYVELTEAVAATEDVRALSALEALEPQLFNHLVLALDNYFAHRARGQELKDGNPLNEVRVLAASLMENSATLKADKSIKLTADSSVLHHHVGDPIALSSDDFAAISAAFLVEIEKKFPAS